MLEVVAAMICRGENFLICRRPEGKSRAMLWEYPGGKVEPGEDLETALIRECREELNLDLKPEKLLYEMSHEYPEMTIHLSLFQASAGEQEPQLLEHCDSRWIRKEEIGNFDFCPADQEMNKALFG